jgi:NAD(P)-dependent dehydrogenase (short-subunit alcohol dehydrogenase family)
LGGGDDFSGRVAIVTGAARGIGLTTAKLLAERGAVVALADRDEARLEAAVAEIEATGHAAVAVPGDVTDPEAVGAGVDAVLGRFERVHVLVNNAGVAGRSVPTWDLTDEDWSSVIGTNLLGPFLFIRAVLPGMRAQSYGRIVNVASIAGKEGNPNAVPYSASKAGIIGLTKSVAKEVATDGVLINCVTPAVINTEILEQVSQEHIDYMLTRIPMGRPGEPEEVAELIAWLASERCSFSTGAVFDISGGRATY